LEHLSLAFAQASKPNIHLLDLILA